MAENADSGLLPKIVTVPNVLIGALVGAATYLAGYLTTFVLILLDRGLDASEFTVTWFLDGGFVDIDVEGIEPGSVEFAGWIFYNAHFVQTVWSSEARAGEQENPALSQSSNVLSEASAQLPAVIYYIVPVALLAAAGYLLARRLSVSTLTESIAVGGMMTIGYLVLAIAGAVLFATAGSATTTGAEFSVRVGPNLPMAGLLAGIIIPTIFGSLGASLGSESS